MQVLNPTYFAPTTGSVLMNAIATQDCTHDQNKVSVMNRAKLWNEIPVRYSWPRFATSYLPGLYFSARVSY